MTPSRKRKFLVAGCLVAPVVVGGAVSRTRLARRIFHVLYLLQRIGINRAGVIPIWRRGDALLRAALGLCGVVWGSPSASVVVETGVFFEIRIPAFRFVFTSLQLLTETRVQLKLLVSRRKHWIEVASNRNKNQTTSINVPPNFPAAWSVLEALPPLSVARHP